MEWGGLGGVGRFGGVGRLGDMGLSGTFNGNLLYHSVPLNGTQNTKYH